MKSTRTFESLCSLSFPPHSYSCVFLFYVRNDPVQQFMLESGKDSTKYDEKCGAVEMILRPRGPFVKKTVESSQSQCASPGNLCGVPVKPRARRQARGDALISKSSGAAVTMMPNGTTRLNKYPWSQGSRAMPVCPPECT